MASHLVSTNDHNFFNYWQGHKNALVMSIDDCDDWAIWDQIVLQCESPKWKNLPMYFKISFKESVGDKMIIHLKR